MGRQRLNLVGPPGIDGFWQHLQEMTLHDIEYRVGLGWPMDAMTPRITTASDGWSNCFDGTIVRSRHVEHVGPHCLGYRWDREGASIVISGDATYCDSLVELARGADLLINNCSLSQRPTGHGGSLRKSLATHVSDPQTAGRIARDASVGHLVLTHLHPDTDPDFVLDGVRSAGFDGRTTVGYDLLSITV